MQNMHILNRISEELCEGHALGFYNPRVDENPRKSFLITNSRRITQQNSMNTWFISF